MVIGLLYKNTLLKIKKSLGRYLSLLLILLVGVGFLAGIQASTPDIMESLGQYMNRQNLMDFEIISSLGLTNDDVQALKALKNVSSVTPSYFLDVLSQGKAIRIQAVEESVNTVQLTAGRMPKNDTECAADGRFYKVGDTVKISSDVSGKLKNTVFTVVGTVKSALYLSVDYGSTTVGDGKLYSYLFVDRDNFTLEAYTQVYITASGVKNAAAFSEEYDTVVSELNDALVKLKPEREKARYQALYTEANTKIQDSEHTLQSQKAKAEKELTDAKAQLDSSAAQLQNAKKELAANEADLNHQIAVQNANFDTAKAQLADGHRQIETGLKEAGITADQLGGKLDALNSAIQSIKEQLSSLPAEDPGSAALEAQLQQYSANYQGLSQLQTSIETLTAQENQLNQGINEFNAKISDAKEKIENGKSTLAENQKKLDDGYTRYQKSLNEYSTKMADADAKIQDAKTKLADLSKPIWIISDRNDVVNGYHDIKSATNTINIIALVLPIFFILVVALMTSNSMARMIAEERGELGTLASLGFDDKDIIFTYLVYVLSATILGTVGGFYLGCTIIPKIIYNCFPYILPPLITRYNLFTLLLILAAAAVLMTAVTVISCHHELKEHPAKLMRPVPPKSGKTILLERIRFIWKHLSFTWKVTMRNIFRYKQRAFMTIAGIACCTALLLAGFGIQDSLNGVAQKQYQSIFTYQDLLVLKNETSDMSEELDTLLAKEHIQQPLLVRQTAFTCESPQKKLDAYLIVPENRDLFEQYFKLRDGKSGAGIKLNDDGVIISQKIAASYKIGKGDTLTVKDTEGKTYALTVLDVTENYIQNYIYMTGNYYGRIFGKSISYNMIVSNYGGDESAISKNLIASSQIVNVNFTDDILRQAIQQNSSLDSVVVLLICIASILAVIVLYNLTSINISERKREIATLKVLGFKDGETNEYIYREAFLLTLISIGCGLLLGVGLHHFVISMIERDEVVYFKSIKGLSFLWTGLITLFFSFMMQIVTYFSLQKIDMLQSLKSVE